MSLSYGCGKCSLPIGGLVERIVCDGCRKEYHLSCTLMNPYQLRVCVEFKNVIWLCDDCLLTFRKQQLSPSNESAVQKGDGIKHEKQIEQAVSQLQCEITTLKQCFVDLQLSMNSGCQRTDNSSVRRYGAAIWEKFARCVKRRKFYPARYRKRNFKCSYKINYNSYLKSFQYMLIYFWWATL